MTIVWYLHCVVWLGQKTFLEHRQKRQQVKHNGNCTESILNSKFAASMLALVDDTNACAVCFVTFSTRPLPPDHAQDDIILMLLYQIYFLKHLCLIKVIKRNNLVAEKKRKTLKLNMYLLCK